ncbi:hypothetical protein Acr_22g0009190 [Actinidia rufa]|uniref:NAC domain-containing protein n=1 Tax=Actinidia rufa TaxID=165716 RepID=A0A7J0GLA2_9ERIC|nr:hypothetical protein Acr_22g0009190 [Actinidia rufa]
MALPVPYGFTFNPKDHELIYLLLRKASGNSLPVEHLIEECDLFGKEEPWEIFGRGMEKTRYFFAKLKKKGKSAHGPNTHGRWLMKEYHLYGVSLQPPPKPKLNDYVLCRIRKKDDGKKQNDETIIHDVRFDTEASSCCQRIGGNQDGEGFGSMNCAENAILGRKRSRIEFMMDYDLPNLSAADAAVMLESIAQDQTTEYRFFNRKEPRIDGDQLMDLLLGAENCVPALSEGVSKSFTQDDEAEFFRGLSPIFEKFSDESFGGRLWMESEADGLLPKLRLNILSFEDVAAETELSTLSHDCIMLPISEIRYGSITGHFIWKIVCPTLSIPAECSNFNEIEVFAADNLCGGSCSTTNLNLTGLYGCCSCLFGTGAYQLMKPFYVIRVDTSMITLGISMQECDISNKMKLETAAEEEAISELCLLDQPCGNISFEALGKNVVINACSKYCGRNRHGAALALPKAEIVVAGLVHYQFNSNAKKFAIAVSAFGSANAGTVSIPSAVFNTSIDNGILAKSFKIDVATIQKIKARLLPKA